jgi:hypothetical protein
MTNEKLDKQKEILVFSIIGIKISIASIEESVVDKANKKLGD